MTRAELIRGFLAFVKDKAVEMPMASKNDVIALCAGPESDYMDDAGFISDEFTEELIIRYLGSLKHGKN